jgi:hypothetical protein
MGKSDSSLDRLAQLTRTEKSTYTEGECVVVVESSGLNSE